MVKDSSRVLGHVVLNENEKREERRMTRRLQQQLLVRAKVIPFAERASDEQSKIQLATLPAITETLAICMSQSETTIDLSEQ